MKTSRNDPCPCGSGKKYKACCMGRDQARAHARSVVGEEVFDEAEAAWMELARNAKVWFADIVPAPGEMREDRDAVLSLVAVSAEEWVVHADVVPRRPAGPGERAREIAAALDTAIRAVGVPPERLEVPGEDLAEVLGRELGGRGILVEQGESEALYEAMSSALANLDPSPACGQMTVALTWRETEATAQELADFHQAAADFYTAIPWASYETSGPFLLDLPRDPEEKPIPELLLPERRRWGASVMGSMGESFGLALYSKPEDLANILTADDPLDAALQSIGFSLTVDFDHKRQLRRSMQREIAAAGWPIAGPRAYPRLFGLGLPGRRVVARDVRLATLALRAVAVLARGGDPLAETGVGVTPFDPEAEDDTRLDWFHLPDEATPIRAEGPAVEPQPPFQMWYSGEQRMEAVAAEQARFGRFAAWLREQGVPEEEAQTDVQNAESLVWMTAPLGSPAAVTEFDLRLFLYDIYARKTDPAPEALHALPRSMRRIVRWLEEREGVGYPFAASVLDELDRIAERAREMDEPLKETLRMLSYDIYDYLDIRSMIASPDLPGVPGGWPDMMTMEVAQLREELQRRWLLWYDELVRGGMTDYGELEDALTARQRAWENTPHPQVGGRTPAEVVAERQA